jgi:hypothetical protein
LREDQKRHVDGSGLVGPCCRPKIRIGAVRAAQRKLFAPCHDLTEVFPRADDGTRTRYLELGKLALYQVSYVREEVSV